LIVALATIAGLSVGLKKEQDKTAAAAPPTTSPSTNITCFTPECVELGNQILSSLDEDINPCDDFYKFACNKYLKRAIVAYGEQ
jgi:hypothetical protein